MKVGNLVVVLADPMLWGAGQIRAVTREGRLLVEFGDLSREGFMAHELELLVRWQKAPCTLN